MPLHVLPLGMANSLGRAIGKNKNPAIRWAAMDEQKKRRIGIGAVGAGLVEDLHLVGGRYSPCGLPEASDGSRKWSARRKL